MFSRLADLVFCIRTHTHALTHIHREKETHAALAARVPIDAAMFPFISTSFGIHNSLENHLFVGKKDTFGRNQL